MKRKRLPLLLVLAGLLNQAYAPPSEYFNPVMAEGKLKDGQVTLAINQWILLSDEGGASAPHWRQVHSDGPVPMSDLNRHWVSLSLRAAPVGWPPPHSSPTFELETKVAPGFRVSGRCVFPDASMQRPTTRPLQNGFMKVWQHSDAKVRDWTRLTVTISDLKLTAP